MLQKVTFTSGMDSDISPEFMAPGKARKRLNVRVLSSDNDQIGGIETVLGNELVSYTLPSGNNQVIGSKEDPKENKIYYFLWNSAGKHQILEYDYSSNVIRLVLREATVAPTYLDFSLDHLITGINIVELDPETRLLYWTDDYVDPADPDVYNEPKKLNIEKAKLHSAGDFVNGYTSPFEPRFITRIKQPPLHAPTYVWEGAPTPSVNIFAATYSGAFITVFYTDPPVIAPFDICPGSPANGFDTGTHIWTVQSDNYYNIYTEVRRNHFDIPMRIYINKVVGGNIYTELLPLVGPVAENYAVGVNNVYLTAGEQIRILVETPGYVISQDGYYKPLLFKADVYSGSVTVNFLNRKFFRFKTQFGYDDRELSAWSPISKYEYPETQAIGETAEAVEYLDNKITITVPTGSSIVKRIRIAVKQFGSTEFSLVADLSKETLNIPDDSSYDFEFLNDGNYVQLETNESSRLFDFVPQRSKAQEVIAGTRIVDGNITENFDPIDIDMKLPISYVPLVPSPTNIRFPNASYFKSGGSYKTGIVYYDYFGNRSSLTNNVNGSFRNYIGDVFGTTLFVPFLTDPLYEAPHSTPINYDMEYVPQVNVEIYNSPPKWATHYQILRSSNQAITKFIQFAAQQIYYLDKTGDFTTPYVATYIVISIKNITGRYKDENKDSQLVYDFSVGDRCRFIANRYGIGPVFNVINPFFKFNDQEVIGYNAGTGEVVIRKTPDSPFDLSPGALFEIYSPAETVVNDNELMYEVAEEGELIEDVNGNLVHAGSISDQQISQFSDITNTAPDFYDVTLSSALGFTVGDKVKIISGNYNIYGVINSIALSVVTVDTTGYTMMGTYLDSTLGTLVKSAESVFTSGDCFRKYCNMPWVEPGTGLINRLYSYIETSAANNMFTSNLDQTGRPNRIDREITRVTRPSTIYWSEFLVPETNINGLSTVYDQSFESYEQRYGGIQKLFNENMGLIMLQELKCAMVPVQRIIYGDLSLQNTVGASTSVLSPQAVYYAGEFGIGKNPESFAVYGSAKYFVDVNRAVVLRLSVDGLTPISDTASMHNYFTDKCRFININGGTKIFGVYDIKFNEYVIAFNGMVVPEPPPAIAAAETIAWNERANQWSTFYSYHPEGMCGSNTGIVSFYGGALYKHNVNTILEDSYNTFYGEHTPSEFWVICNASPSNVKILLAISEETNSPWAVHSITTPNKQESNLIESDFQEKENNQYAALWKDQLTPNVVHPLINGDVMRDRTFLAKFRYRESVYNKINAVNFEIIPSNLSNR
jgi:hypothetical protein